MKARSVGIAKSAAAIAVAGMALVGCNKNRTEIVIGVATDLPARQSLDRVRLDLFRVDPQAGEIQLNVCDKDTTGSACTNWDLKDPLNMGLFDLPGSYGLYTEDGSAPRVRVNVIGEKGGQDIVTRSSIVSLLAHQTLFMRMALVLKCTNGNPNASCPSGLTCIEGACQAMARDPATLPKYTAGLEKVVQCSGSTTFIDTSKNNAPIPMTGPGCEANEECQEGTCYTKPTTDAGAGGTIAGYAGRCGGNMVCAQGFTCAVSVFGGLGYCRQGCTTPSDCSNNSPEMVDPMAGVGPQLAGCEAPKTGAAGTYCTFPCNPVFGAGASGCHSGQLCVAYNSTSPTATELYTECLDVTNPTPKGDGQTCASATECLSGYTCTQTSIPDGGTSGLTCRAMCRVSKGLTGNTDCTGIDASYSCCPQRFGPTSSTDSTRFGACKPSCN
jgi:hypothetical protein